MKRNLISALAAAAFCVTASVYAEGVSTNTAQTPVFDASAYNTLRNIDARLAELNLKLSTPQVKGCSDGEHIYSPGINITRGAFAYECIVKDGEYRWNQYR